MKKMLVVSLVLASMLFAGDAEDKARVATMQTLESAMENIQKGFLYNNKKIVELAIENLQKTLTDVNAFIIEVSDKDKKKDFDPKTYALTESTAIGEMVKRMETLYNDGKHDEALDVYAKTLKRCVVCHKIIRKW